MKLKDFFKGLVATREAELKDGVWFRKNKKK